MSPYEADWFAMGYQDGYAEHWWPHTDDLDDADLQAYTDGYRAGLSEREADW